MHSVMFYFFRACLKGEELCISSFELFGPVLCYTCLVLGTHCKCVVCLKFNILRC